MLIQYLNNLARYRRIDPVEYYVSHDHRMVYVENAKVACTAIKQAMFPDIAYDDAGQNEFHAILRTRACFAPPAGTQDYCYFSVFREPCARFASAFRDKIVREGAEGIFGLRSQRMIFGLYGGIDPVAQTTDIRAFAQAVRAVPEALRDRHIANQTAVLKAVTDASDHWLLKLENLAEGWAELQGVTGIGDLPVLNQTGNENSPPIDPDADWVQIVSQAYAEDFETLNYLVPRQ